MAVNLTFSTSVRGKTQMRGPYKNRGSEHARAIELRKIGYGYRSISGEIGVPWRTVCGWVKHIPVDERTAYEYALARREQEGFPVEERGTCETHRRAW